ncbi:hypothetical protein [Poseidonocella sp. HB161398]|uniref:hypothetical protein n=1 Tax=Poseidonocella sp. HB161398 TaxID=2320855 RepID=UPI0011095667|nr:hypothetical protein [Poseidonocella sp. HB161398]
MPEDLSGIAPSCWPGRTRLVCGYGHAVDTEKVFLFANHKEGQSPYAVTAAPKEVRDTAGAAGQGCVAGIAPSRRR